MSVRALVSSLVLTLVIAASAGPHVMQPVSGQENAETLVSTYYQIANAGFRGGDFSAMASVFAPDATFSHSTTQGETIVLHGLQQIIAYYHRTFISVPGVRFVRDTWYDLSPNIVLNYEHTEGGAIRVPARCSHLFVIKNGRISKLFWVVYFAGRR